MQALRTFLAAAAIALGPLLAQAAITCDDADAKGAQRCRAGLASEQVQQMKRTQEKSQWCWAASIAMVLSRHGIEMRQEDIVRRQFGDALDIGASGEAITRLLASAWRDQQGRQVYPEAIVGDSAARRHQLGNAGLVEELTNDRPIIFGAESHAMVLVQVEFERSAGNAIRITGGTVIDPMPGQGVRRLARNEMRPSYVAAVQVQGSEQLAMARRTVAAQ